MEFQIPYQPNEKQKLFHASPCEEVFYGGAKGGGKSCALTIEAFIYGMEYPGAKIYLFRESYDQLEATLIKEWLEKIPPQLYRGNPKTQYSVTLVNKTEVFFRYLEGESDAKKYDGREMDFVGVDELTKHSEKAIQVLLSCLRSPKGFPPRFRATGNPGGPGHMWVKRNFVDATDYGQHITLDPVTGSRRQFVPAFVWDNPVLMDNDPNYVKRLQNLPEDERKALLHGEWNIFAGQYYPEFSREIHIVRGELELPSWHKKFRCMDYGLDMTACYWIDVDDHNKLLVYRELHQSGLNLTQAANRINEMTERHEQISYTVASKDLWNRNKDTGVPEVETMIRHGLRNMKQADNRRIPGWRLLREYLTPYDEPQQDGTTRKTAKLLIHESCYNLIKALPAIQRDDNDFEDVADEPHELTHAPEAIRYGVMSRPPKAIDEKTMAKLRRRRQIDSRPVSSITGY